MLDINLLREEKGGNPELVRESQRRRFADVELVDLVINLDKSWRNQQFELEQLKKEFNCINKEIGNLKKAKKDASELQERSKEVKLKIQEAETMVVCAEDERDLHLKKIGNIIHDSVPVSKDENQNEIVKTYGEAKIDASYLNHVDLVTKLNLANFDIAQKVAGSRAYYLINEGPLLNQALINYAMQFAYGRGYSPVHTPFFMNKEIMAECAQLSQFDEELYKVTGEGEEKYLIATSEQTLCALHRKRWFEKEELPVKLVGYSTCFRKEAGSHGRDTLGIFRVHQFEKVEQFVICSSEGNESWNLMEEMRQNAEDFYQSLGIPYRMVVIVSGEINDAAAKKYDLEAWFPASKTYRELVSCSNCTDYQARNLDTRMRASKQEGATQDKKYVHMLNSTLTATERTICCILENYQTPEGIRIPDVLVPFMAGIKFIPFVKQKTTN